LILNHRNIKVIECEPGKEPGRPPTRQQRRASGYSDVTPEGEKRDHYKIYLPAVGSYKKCVRESERGKNVRERCPHDVRGHLRRDQYGRKRIKVRDGKRCQKSSKPYFMADYDAANVGMEN